jgi:outer membrane receptor protein involved in Fe transport
MRAFVGNTHRPLAAAIATILLGALGPKAVLAAEQKATGGSATSLEEVVVTATKRQESLINVPAAITALSSDTLESLGVQGFQDYLGLVPGLSQRGGGTPGVGTVIIRGLNSGPQQTTATTGYYFDDAPFTANGALSISSFVLPDADLSDVERVEVLKGPQGTLYGASSLGGLIRIQSKRPDLKAFSGNVGVSGVNVDDGSSGYGARGMLNMPLSADRLGLRLSGFYRKEPGFTTNVGTGHVNVNEATIEGGRLSMLAKLSDDADLLITGLYQKIHSDAPGSEDTKTDTLTPLYGEKQFSAYFDPTSDLKIKTAAATLNWKAGPGTLTGTIAYNKYDTLIVTDYTNVYGQYLGLVLPGLWPTAAAGVKGDLAPASEKISAELRYASERIGNVEFIGGLFYTDEDDLYPVVLSGEFKATGQPLPSILAKILNSSTASTYKESAAFGNLTYYFTDSTDLTLGARYAKNKQDVTTVSSGLIATGGGGTNLFNSEENSTTYLATLRWRASDNVSYFLRAASGYRPGGPQTANIPNPVPYSADTVWNYEAGVKLSAMERRMNMSASIYHIDWKDMQLNGLSGGFLLTGNAGKSRVNGAEFELQYLPSERALLGLSMGYTDTEITEISAAASANLGAVAGDPLPLTAKFTGAATADYFVPISEGTKASFGFTFKYQGDRPSSFSKASLNPNIDIPAYTALDFRMGIDWGRYRVQLQANNVMNEKGYLSAQTNKVYAGQPVPTNVSLLRPTSYSVSFTADF